MHRYPPNYASDVYEKPLWLLCAKPPILLPIRHCPDYGLLEKGCHGLAQCDGHRSPLLGDLGWLPSPCLLSTQHESQSLDARAV